ncbi:MAG: HD domain-containing protein [Candidatus Portnoybacteria bacterium]|nr:HD domain-containing protein [Candidatus Portnoybacteria bacterium]
MRTTQKERKIIQELEQYVRESLPPENLDIKSHDWKHAFRVRNWALKIAKGEGYKNTFLLEIASLLHDIGRLKEKELKRPHAPISGEMAKEYLAKKKWLSKEEVEEVIYAITHHSKGGETKLSHIVQDADRLDGFGAMGLIRTFMPQWHLTDYDPVNIVNPFTMSKAHVDAFFSSHPGKQPVSYAVDMLPYALSWYDQMNTKTGKKIAAPLVEYTKGFLEEFKRETEGLT